MFSKIYSIPEELAEIGKTDFSKFSVGPKSLSEMVNDDRF
jgi:hypothetical protein